MPLIAISLVAQFMDFSAIIMLFLASQQKFALNLFPVCFPVIQKRQEFSSLDGSQGSLIRDKKKGQF